MTKPDLSDKHQLRVLTMTECVALLGVSKPTLYRWMASGAFPSPKQLGPSRVGVLEADVLKWLESRPPAKWTQGSE